MSNRENIMVHIVTELTADAAIKTVTREPKEITELSPQSFPHVLIEAANETREHASFGNTVRRESTMDVVLNGIVHGSDRDSKRNTLIAAIESKLDEDVTLGGYAYDSEITEIQIREIAETAPYGQFAMVLQVKYFYDKGTP
jgi:hypothetical protein